MARKKDKYKPGLYVGVFGALSAAFVYSTDMPDFLVDAEKVKKARSDAAIAKTRAESDRKIAEAAINNQVFQPKKLILEGYYFHPKKPPVKKWHEIAGKWNFVIIGDAMRYCVGYVEEGAFFFRASDTNAETVCTTGQKPTYEGGK
ncbi:MAG: hypothetical protein F6K65_18035 [Moorea sp. SIO3C2]|nr:hypothetical protein [Moorena sp. SIO3C2]